MKFEAKVEKMGDEGGWHIARIPSDTVRALRDESQKKGNIPVICLTGKSTWTSTIMSLGEQQWFVAIKTDIRKAENIQEGDTVVIDIRPDPKRLPAQHE